VRDRRNEINCPKEDIAKLSFDRCSQKKYPKKAAGIPPFCEIPAFFHHVREK
jgi:hypothetical protein